ncbi:MAG TPA: hypothetical protein VFJ57_08930 [Solirubrobacterales bacterium]|nr:hypothetical protein [Solirubrobacterales bacterium]
MGGERRGWALVKLAGLLVLAALSLSAWVEAASAIASETTLCETNASSPACVAVSRYPAATTLEAEFSPPASPAKFVLGSNVVLCETSFIGLEATEASGEPLPVVLSGPAFWSCKTTLGRPCTVTPTFPENGPEVVWKAGDDGAVLVRAGPGEPKAQIKFVCSGVLNCTYATGLPELELEGGNPAAAGDLGQLQQRDGGAVQLESRLERRLRSRLADAAARAESGGNDALRRQLAEPDLPARRTV